MRIEAAFDCLTIASLLQDIDPGPSKGEVHLLAYLASLLSVYARAGEGASDWGYSFAATPGGAPFGEGLEVEMEELISGGALVVTRTNVRITGEGSQLQRRLAGLGLVQDRFNYLDSAISTTFAMPVGMVRAAFAYDPDVLVVAEHRRSRILGSDSALARLYAEFDAVADVLGTDRRSLLAASVLWLTYLTERDAVTARA